MGPIGRRLNNTSDFKYWCEIINIVSLALKASLYYCLLAALGTVIQFCPFGLNECTGISHFAKVRVMPLHVHERPPLVPVFTNPKKSKEGFHFYEKRQEVKTAFRYV